MKNSEVFIAKCSSYNPTRLVIDDALDDVGLLPDDECKDKCVVVKAVLGYLSSLRSLTSEKEVDLANSYDRKGLEAHMRMLCKHFNLDASEYLLDDNMTSIEDGSNYW